MRCVSGVIKVMRCHSSSVHTRRSVLRLPASAVPPPNYYSLLDRSHSTIVYKHNCGINGIDDSSNRPLFSNKLLYSTQDFRFVDNRVPLSLQQQMDREDGIVRDRCIAPDSHKRCYSSSIYKIDRSLCPIGYGGYVPRLRAMNVYGMSNRKCNAISAFL